MVLQISQDHKPHTNHQWERELSIQSYKFTTRPPHIHDASLSLSPMRSSNKKWTRCPFNIPIEALFNCNKWWLNVEEEFLLYEEHFEGQRRNFRKQWKWKNESWVMIQIKTTVSIHWVPKCVFLIIITLLLFHVRNHLSLSTKFETLLSLHKYPQMCNNSISWIALLSLSDCASVRIAWRR